MPRVRRAVRRRRARALGAVAALAVAVAAVIVLPFVVASGPAGPLARRHALAHARSDSPSPQVSGYLTPSAAGFGGQAPPWARRLSGEVAYKCGYDICLMQPDGRAGEMLSAATPEWDPAWSPDGRELAFRGYYGPGDGQYDLYTADLTRCHVTRMTRQYNGTSSSWSPNGRQIAFSTPNGIYVINVNGKGPRKISGTVSGYSYGSDTPAWSAGNKIAYARYVPSQHRAEIYTMSPDGSGSAPLTSGAPGFGQPAWSPDGRSIAVVAGSGSATSVEVAAADGTGLHRVSPRGWTSTSPTWTPGGQIAFLRWTGQRGSSVVATSAYIVNRDGSGLRLLYRHLNAIEIAWGPAALSPRRC